MLHLKQYVKICFQSAQPNLSFITNCYLAFQKINYMKSKKLML
jgi:hypothetical protein